MNDIRSVLFSIGISCFILGGFNEQIFSMLGFKITADFKLLGITTTAIGSVLIAVVITGIVSDMLKGKTQEKLIKRVV
ncbi:hypothetical protein [Bacillus mycoides]|uniref:hypothetical protein n=1 Tax=Bacillus mycoides TaxID=1405 RepID=UPI0010BEE586|nr:hypothetical protein [Bacillus mycoides]TKI45567.1 hypothetical protein FC700_10485 [Bacillus mycoides]